ncbi:26765_t:CDS:1, partial [Racocetra persica]
PEKILLEIKISNLDIEVSSLRKTASNYSDTNYSALQTHISSSSGFSSITTRQMI